MPPDPAALGTTYCYVVVAVNKTGLVSSYSAEVRATAGDRGRPRATAGGALPLTLAWTAPRLNADGTALMDLAGYKVYRGTASGTYGTVADVGFKNEYFLPTLARGTYYFRVTACDQVGNESKYSNELTCIIP